MEDINNILNSGEVRSPKTKYFWIWYHYALGRRNHDHVVFVLQVPNLFEPEEYEQVIIGTRPHAKEAGIAEGDR